MTDQYLTRRDKQARDARLNFLADRELAERDPCPECGAEAEQTCTTPDGREVPYPAHLARYPKNGGAR